MSRARRLCLHAGVILVTLALCAAVSIWAVGRSEAERSRMLRQQTGIALSLTRMYAHLIADRIFDDGNAAVLALGRTCPLCADIRRIAPDAPPDAPPHARPETIDLTPTLAAMIRAEGSGALVALAGPDGILRGLRPDGAAFTGRLRHTSPVRIAAGIEILDMFDLDTVARTVVGSPVAPGLILVRGDDVAARLAGIDRRHWQDGLWAGATCLLLAAATATAIAVTERAARQRRRMSGDRQALTLLNAELHAAHGRLRIQNADLETTFAAMSDGVSYFDRDQLLVRWNQRMPALTGTPAGVLRPGVSLREVLRAQALAGEFGPLPDPEAVEAEVRRRLEVAAGGFNERTRPNGTSIELRRTVLADGGSVTIYTDVTSRTQIAAAHESARRTAERNADEKARFAAIVSHEIRSPLNVILNSLGLIDRGAIPPGQRALVETGLHAGEALLALVNDILDLSRLEAGKLPIVAAPFAPRALVAGVAEMFRPLARQRGIALVVAVAPDVPQSTVGDAGRVRQILVNLVSNAAKFAGPGTVTLDVGIVGGTDAGGPCRLRIGVRDSGPVIPLADRARMFRPFTQLGPASSSMGESSVGESSVGGSSVAGSGLGLAICSLLARRMGGSIAVDEAVSSGGVPGNEFSVVVPLPAFRAPAWPAPAFPAPAWPARAGLVLPAGARRAPRTRLLVVEDGDANRWLLATMLRRDGHHVEVADGGASALARLRQVPFDLVLMDLSMPGMDGLEATRALRALDGPAGQTPVIGVTAHTAVADRDRGIAAGMAAVLPKPVEAAALREAILRHVWSGSAPFPVRSSAHASLAPAIPGLPGRPVLDRSRLHGIPGAERLLQACAMDLAAMQAALEQAASQGDLRRLLATAHAMAGAAVNHGFVALGAVLQGLVDVREIDVTVLRMVAGVADGLAAARAAIGQPGPEVVGATGIEPVTLRV